MKKEVSDLWTTALRSGDYVQGKGALNEHGKFCCLGVLCDVAVKNGLDISVTKQGNIVAYDDVSAFLPYSVRIWAGMRSRGGNRDRGDGGCLWHLNDEYDKSFNEIADVIDKEWETL